MSTLKRPSTMGTKPIGTSRIPPVGGGGGGSSSRSGTPAARSNGTANGNNSSTNATAASALDKAKQPVTGRQNLLDKDKKIPEYSSPADKCPVCYSDRYLNPSLRLMVSKCYHKMCESCIDRLFTLGPGPCPTCDQIIRKTQFMPQTYEDLGVEKEVVIRKRIAKIFNKTQEDFPDTKTYNDYLELVEDMTFNLINSIDVEETDRRILAYQRENAEQIDLQSSFEDQQAELIRLRDEEDRRLKTERALEFAKQDEEDKVLKQQAEKDLIKALEESENSESANNIIKKQRAVALKKSSARHALVYNDNPLDSNKPSLLSKMMGYNRSTFGSHQQNDENSYAPEDPLSDYDSLYYDYRDLFELREEEKSNDGTTYYRDSQSENALHDLKKMAGGLDVRSAIWERSIRSAVMGLWTMPLGVVGGHQSGQVEVTGDAVMV